MAKKDFMPKMPIADDGHSLTVPIFVDPSSDPKKWAMMVYGRPCVPNPGEDAQGAISLAQSEGATFIKTYGESSFFSVVLKSRMPGWIWAIVPFCILGAWLMGLQGKTIPFWDKVFFNSFEISPLLGVGSFFLVFLVFALLFFFFSCPLAWRVCQLKLPYIQTAFGSDPFEFDGPSAGGAFLLSYLDYCFCHWPDRPSWLPVPGWFQQFRKYGPQGVAISIEIAQGASFRGVGEWPEKIQAIITDKTIRLVICAKEDMENLAQAWNAKHKRGGVQESLEWEKIHNPACRKAIVIDNGRQLEFLACQNLKSLSDYLENRNPHSGLIRGCTKVGLLLFAMLPLSMPICPNPLMTISFKGAVPHFVGESGIPQLRLVPDQEILMIVRAEEGCAKGTNAALSVEARLPVLKKNTSSELSDTLRKAIVYQEEEVILVKMPSQPGPEAIDLLLRLDPLDHCRQADQRQYRLIRKDSTS